MGFCSDIIGDTSLSHIDCDFEAADGCNYIQETSDDFDWVRNKGATDTYGTGPSYDHTYGTASGKYRICLISNSSTCPVVLKLLKI